MNLNLPPMILRTLDALSLEAVVGRRLHALRPRPPLPRHASLHPRRGVRRPRQPLLPSDSHAPKSKGAGARTAGTGAGARTGGACAAVCSLPCREETCRAHRAHGALPLSCCLRRRPPAAAPPRARIGSASTRSTRPSRSIKRLRLGRVCDQRDSQWSGVQRLRDRCGGQHGGGGACSGPSFNGGSGAVT